MAVDINEKVEDRCVNEADKKEKTIRRKKKEKEEGECPQQIFLSGYLSPCHAHHFISIVAMRLCCLSVINTIHCMSVANPTHV